MREGSARRVCVRLRGAGGCALEASAARTAAGASSAPEEVSAGRAVGETVGRRPSGPLGAQPPRDAGLGSEALGVAGHSLPCGAQRGELPRPGPQPQLLVSAGPGGSGQGTRESLGGMRVRVAGQAIAAGNHPARPLVL